MLHYLILLSIILDKNKNEEIMSSNCIYKLYKGHRSDSGDFALFVKRKSLLSLFQIFNINCILKI